MPNANKLRKIATCYGLEGDADYFDQFALWLDLELLGGLVALIVCPLEIPGVSRKRYFSLADEFLS